MSTSPSHQRPRISHLPWEIISDILTIAVNANIAEGLIPSYTFGLSRVTQTLQLRHKVQVEKYVTGRIPPDSLRWMAADAIRRTCSIWHAWAMGYNMRELYVTRWRGAESWDPKFFALPSSSRGPLTSEVFPVVYQDPYRSFASTVTLLQEYSELASHVRRLWFSGIYQFHHVSKIFELTRSCNNLVSLSLPWSSLRYGTVEDWIYVTNNLRIASLEFLGEDVKQSHIRADVNTTVNHEALRDFRVDFSKLRRLKIHGSSNVQSIVDADLWEIARTAINLEEIHITGSSSVTIEGVITLLSSSRTTLRVINYAPIAPTTAGMPKVHVCDVITSCPNLIDVNITVPQLCEHLFCPPPQYSINMTQFDELPSKWDGVAIIRLSHGGRTCLHPNLPLEHPENCAEVQGILEAARKLQQITSGVTVELSIGKFTFTPASFSVVGDFRGAKKIAEGMWEPERERESRRGPWGSSGLCEDIGGRMWTEIGEADFFYGVNCGLIRFEN